MNKDALIGLLFWIGYHQIIATGVSFLTGWNWWHLQPFVILGSVLMFALTFGSQTRSEK
jgi:type IV secretory pathway VirB2 component (pilin)